MIEEIYNKLKQKYDLPDFDLLNKEFDLYTIDEEDFPLRSVRNKIIEKVDSAITLFDDILHPDRDFSRYMEANVFSDSDRDGMMITYRRLMFFKRLSTELYFEDSKQTNIKFINDFMKEWPELKSSILAFTKRLKDSWEKDIPKKEFVGYLG